MAAVDNFASFQPSVEGPYNNAAAITPSDANELANVTSAIWVGGAGNLSYVPAEGSAAVVITSIPAGTLLKIRAKQVTVANTDATLMIALW